MLIARKLVVFWLFIGVLLVSCRTANGKSKIIPTPSSTIGTITSATPTRMPTIVLPSPNPTVLPTILPLSDEEAYSLLSDMLHPGTTCELPCWLNATPGRSFLTDVYFEWAPLLGITATYTDFPSTGKGSMDFIYKTDNYSLKIFTNYVISPSTEVFESIEVMTEVTHYLGNDNFEYAYTAEINKNILSDYLLPNLLSAYGPPAQILISMEIISAEPTSPDFFSVWLLYPTRGAIVRYEGSADVEEDIIHGCPSGTFVSLWLVNPANVKLYENTLKDATGHSDIVTGSPYYKSTMEAIGMSAEEFYEVFKNPTERCIESPLDIWPEP